MSGNDEVSRRFEGIRGILNDLRLMLGDMLALPPAMVRWKIRAIRTDFARHLIHARRLRPARRLLAPALCERPTLERIGLMSVSCLPVQVLDARRRLRMRGRRLVRNP